jgi:signal transduction histidine kinase
MLTLMMKDGGSQIKAKVAELGELKRLLDCGSPINWMFLALAGANLFYFTLKPTALELVLMFIIDTAAFQLNVFVDKKLFTKIYPNFSPIFPETDVAVYEKYNEEERLEFLKICFLFPKKRFPYCFLESLVKVVPAISFVVFFWKHPTRSNLSQFLLMLSVCMLIWTYYCSVVFIDSHRFLSKLIQTLHNKQDWTQTFMKLKAEQITSIKEFQSHEFYAPIFLGVFTFLLQGVILYNSPVINGSVLFQIAFTGLIGLALFSRIFFLSRNFFTESLFTIFHRMEKMDLKSSHYTLPLHTTPLLARFEQSFNILMQRLKDHEQELSYLVLKESDRSRYQALGEISALVAHDMSGPLHVVQFIAQELRENPELAKNTQYIERLNSGIERAMDLLNSLKARLKNDQSNKTSQSFVVAHQHVLKILEVQFYNKNFSKIQFHLDNRLKDLNPQMPHVDLIHIIENLYKNSVKNMIDNAISNPSISVEVEQLSGKAVYLLISDSGTGLSKERFEELTVFRFLQTPSRQRVYEGLGASTDTKTGRTSRLSIRRRSKKYKHTRNNV